MNERILICGASIAGQTLAYWLTRHGFVPTVVERAPRPRPGGQGVDVRDQAVEVAERMGIMPQLRAVAADVAGMRFVNRDGREEARIDMESIRQKQGSGEVEIMRGDLLDILYGLTKNDVEYLFGDSVAAVQQTDDGVDVRFEHGPARTFDSVIGADGLHSTVRRLVFGPESEFVHYLKYYFAFGNADPELAADRCMTMFNTPGRSAGVYRSGNHAGAKAYFAFHSETPLDYDHRDIDDHRRLLRTAFANESSWHVPELLDGLLNDPDLYFDALSQVHMPSWSSGRVVLAGDAAYCASPVAGGGAALALTGAYRLAGELAAADGDHRVAFPRYEQAHRPLVKRMQQVGPNLKLTLPRTRIGIGVRNVVTRLPLGAFAGMERIMTPTAAPLPDYTRGVPRSAQ